MENTVPSRYAMARFHFVMGSPKEKIFGGTGTLGMRTTVSGTMAQPRPASARRKADSTLLTFNTVAGVTRYWLKISRVLMAMDCSPLSPM